MGTTQLQRCAMGMKGSTPIPVATTSGGATRYRPQPPAAEQLTKTSPTSSSSGGSLGIQRRDSALGFRPASRLTTHEEWYRFLVLRKSHEDLVDAESLWPEDENRLENKSLSMIGNQQRSGTADLLEGKGPRADVVRLWEGKKTRTATIRILGNNQTTDVLLNSNVWRSSQFEGMCYGLPN